MFVLMLPSLLLESFFVVLSLSVHIVEEPDVGVEGQRGVDQHEEDILVTLNFQSHKGQIVVFQFSITYHLHAA